MLLFAVYLLLTSIGIAQSEECDAIVDEYISKELNKSPRTTISSEEIESYHKNGYLIINQMFTLEEMNLLENTIVNDPTILNNTMSMTDSNNKKSTLTLWFSVRNDDLYSMFSRSLSINNIIYKLIDDEAYQFHSKIMYKEPFIGGSWNYHQDFGYWYNQGASYPNYILSVMIAIDDHNVQNGCLKVLKQSHLFGRIDHGIYNDQQTMDPNKFNFINQHCETVNVELKRGDLLIWHSNLVHWSEDNTSDNWRKALIIGYNAKNVPIDKSEGNIIIDYKKIDLIHNDEILNCGLKGHTRGRTDFLTREENIDSFNK